MESNTVKLIGVDVGTTFTGVSIFTVSLDTFDIIHLDTILINASIINTGGMDLQNRLNYIYSTFYNILKYYQPSFVTLEYAFINRFRPGAYGPLSQCRGILELAITEFNKSGLNLCNVLFTGLSPATVKNAVGAKGGSGKIPVKDAIMKIQELTKHVNCNVISEDEIDSIAVGYTSLNIIRQNPLILLRN